MLSMTVLGMELYRDVLQILVSDNSDYRRPQWLPLELFEITTSGLPANWYFVAYPDGAPARERGFRARWDIVSSLSRMSTVMDWKNMIQPR
jgi:hypothetical protein